jgi:hypothetical protein
MHILYAPQCQVDIMCVHGVDFTGWYSRREVTHEVVNGQMLRGLILRRLWTASCTSFKPRRSISCSDQCWSTSIPAVRTCWTFCDIFALMDYYSCTLSAGRRSIFKLYKFINAELCCCRDCFVFVIAGRCMHELLCAWLYSAIALFRLNMSIKLLTHTLVDLRDQGARLQGRGGGVN